MSWKFFTLPCLALAAALLVTESGYAQTTGRTSGGTAGRTTGNTGDGATGGGAGGGMTAGAGGQVVSGQTQNVQQSATFLGAGGSGGFVGAGGGGQQTQSRSTGRQFQQFNSSTLQLPRPQLVIAFDVPEFSSQAMEASLVNTLQGVPTTIPGEGRFPGVTPTFTDGGQVRLEGSVPDQRSRQLAEMLVRLEPGVRSVQNDLVVVPASKAP
jgi:hypothetical protein